ncbi:NADPH-dependent FMN reductase [Streptomyces luteireticuli]|uniref:NADPH-dependent FMN reductase n=1 Tax=Streptomyces luteireticuli TaxID=173858 RepID=UPI0035561B94
MAVVVLGRPGVIAPARAVTARPRRTAAAPWPHRPDTPSEGTAMATPPHTGRNLSYFVMSASARADSWNTRLARLAASVIEERGGTAEVATIGDFDVPGYHGDHEVSDGIPDGAERFRSRLLDHDAFVISSPEYNASVPGVLKNLIDWTSRFRPQPFNERLGLLMSASPSRTGGNRSLWALRVPLEALGARVHPDMFSLAQSATAFGEDGRLAHGTLQEQFEENVRGYMDLVEAIVRYPCAKKAWVEYLGQRPDPAFRRAE